MERVFSSQFSFQHSSFFFPFSIFLVPRNHIDDEYATAEYRDPMILITTSRDPSPRLVNF